MKIKSENKEALAELNSKMEELENMEKPLVENGFGNTWLGCLVTALGGDPKKCDARGDWNSRTFDGDEINYFVEEAWGHKYLVDLLIMEKYPDLKVSFYAEETGCEIYFTNDPESFPYKYIVDSEIGDGEEYFKTEQEAVNYLNGLLETEFKSLEEAVAFTDENDDDDKWTSIHVVDVDTDFYDEIRKELEEEKMKEAC